MALEVRPQCKEGVSRGKSRGRSPGRRSSARRGLGQQGCRVVRVLGETSMAAGVQGTWERWGPWARGGDAQGGLADQGRLCVVLKAGWGASGPKDLKLNNVTVSLF